MSTESDLILWRHGQVQAERLAGAVLDLAGYSALDPQCPLGGPDGVKDLLCAKDGNKFVGACFFPTTEKTYAQIKKKFLDDFEGVEKNAADGFVFVTNQRISPTERKELKALGGGAEVDVFHVERIRLLLDNPRGYGVRAEYLRRTMNSEEQIAFFAEWRLTESRALRELVVSVDALSTTQSLLVRKFDASKASAIVAGGETKQVEGVGAGTAVNISAKLSVGLVCAVHRALHLGDSAAGRLRDVVVWIGPPGCRQDEARFTPMAPAGVASALANIIDIWNAQYVELAKAPSNERIKSAVDFHHAFLNVHPFVDGNGRIARFLLALQLEETCGLLFSGEDLPSKEYASALVAADNGNLVLLRELITRLVSQPG